MMSRAGIILEKNVKNSNPTAGQQASAESSSMNSEHEDQLLKKLGLAVIQNESQSVAALSTRIDDNFVQACRYMLACNGRIVVLGMGKSGHIGGKIAATLASTGSPSFFVHPGEASHGDLGMITRQDVVIAISNSGETDELLTILPLIKRLGVPLISMTGNASSTLSRTANVNIDVSVAQEACPLGLAPTSSTTATLAMGDALAVSLLESRGFDSEDFARTHPAGRLGRRLLLLIRDIMRVGSDIPKVTKATTLGGALITITEKGLGMTAVVNENDHVVGIFTDGDLRRVMDQKINIHEVLMADVMTHDCKTVSQDILAAEALQIMESFKINALLVVDCGGALVGVLNMHDLLRAGVV